MNNNNGRSINVLTAAIYGNTIDSVKLGLKLCEMKRWTSTVLILSFLTLMLISCVAVLLIVGDRPEDRDEDVPLHPVGSSSYPNSSSKSSRSINTHDEHDERHDHHSHQQQPTSYHDNDDEHSSHEHRHNYRKRFTDAIKGVFSDLLNSTKNSVSAPKPTLTLSSPIFEENLPTHHRIPLHNSNSIESTENNSSRLKRQLDFGSTSSEEQGEEPKKNEDISKEREKTTEASAEKFTPPSKRPFLRLSKKGVKSATTTSASTSSSSSPSPRFSSSSEETSSEENKRGSGGGGKYRKGIRRFRPNQNSVHPKLQSLSSREKYDVSREEEEDAPGAGDRKNFTLEVVQVERKVTRKEDGNIPPLFKQGTYNIEPRLLKVSKKEGANRPQVLYKKDPRSNSPPSPTIKSPSSRASNRRGKGGSSKEATTSREQQRQRNLPSIEVSSAEETVAEVKQRPRSSSSSGELKRPVTVNVQQQIPYNEQDLSDEDLKDYHDGHSTFGSKGNFTHTILSRNVAGFVPNHSAEDNPTSKRSKSDRKIVIEKGKVTEKYPKDHYVNPNPEIYSVPGGGRSRSSTENSAQKQEAFPFTRMSKRKGRPGGGGGDVDRRLEDNDRTSPAIPYSLEELHRKGHPGVLPAPKQISYRSHPLSDPYGESAAFSSPFSYNPLVDELPLKFDPESDRYYGEPIPDNKERVAQSNSPVQVENRQGLESEEPRNEEFFKPKKRDSEEEDRGSEQQNSAAEDEGVDNSRERPARPPKNNPSPSDSDRYFYGRAYNPPDFAANYDTEPPQDEERGKEDDHPTFDFVGLDDNFEPRDNNDGGREREGGGGGEVRVSDDFFDFPEGIGSVGGGRGGESRFKPRSDSRERDEDNEDDRHRSNEGPGRSNERSTPDYTEHIAPEIEEQPVRRPPPQRESRRRDPDSDYDANNEYGFGPAPRQPDRRSNSNIEDDEPNHHPDVYDTGFIDTLKQFDEEIKKLQEEEREKLLKSTALPDQGKSSESNDNERTPPRTSTSGYRHKEPPLIITSPGPIKPAFESSPPVDDGPSTPASSRFDNIGTTIRVADHDDEDDEEEEEDVTEGNPFITSSREPTTESGEDTTTLLPNRSIGAEEEDDDDEPTTTNKSFEGLNDYSTERSEEGDDEKKKKKKK